MRPYIFLSKIFLNHKSHRALHRNFHISFFLPLLSVVAATLLFTLINKMPKSVGGNHEFGHKYKLLFIFYLNKTFNYQRSIGG